MPEISWIYWSARVLSLLAVTMSVGSIIFIQTRNILSQKIMAAGVLAFSLMLVSMTWGYKHIAPLLQFLFTTGAGLGLILASVLVQSNKLILATYVVTVTFILAFIHILIAFNVFSFLI